MITASRAVQLLDELNTIRDPELVLLKGHMLLERVLVAALAARMNVPEENIPRLNFGATAHLAFGGPHRELAQVNDLRNIVAHEFDALDSESFAKLLEKLNCPWPGGALERCIVLEHLLLRFIYSVFVRMFDYVVEQPEEPGVEFDPDDYFERQEIRERLTQSAKASETYLERARRGEWDDLVAELRPGWRSHSSG